MGTAVVEAVAVDDVPSVLAGRRRLLPPVPRSMRGLVHRELTYVAVGTQVVWLLADPDLRPWAGWPPLASGALVAVLAAGVLLLASQYDLPARARRWIRYLDVAVVLVAMVVVGAVPDAGAWEAASTLAVLAAVVMAALLQPTFAVVGIPLLAVMTWEPVRSEFGASPSDVPEQAFLVPSYVLVVGLSCVLIHQSLRSNAVRVDGDLARREGAASADHLVRGVEIALRTQERVLHETVLNTLTAIARGGLGPSVASILRARCREAKSVLDSLLASEGSVGSVGSISELDQALDPLITGLRAEGVVVDAVIDDVWDLPAPVRGALVTALREALLNVDRHAQAATVQVRVRVRRSGGLRVQAEVTDDGVGFAPDSVIARFGLVQSVDEAMREVGGLSRIESRPGSGTRVTLEWHSPAGPDAIDRFRDPSRDFALTGVATFAMVIGTTVGLAWLQFGHPPISGTDIALVLVVATLLGLATPEAPLPWGLVVLVAALGPLAAALQASAYPSETSLASEWVFAGIAVSYGVSGAIGPPRAWLLLVPAWLVADLAATGDVLQPATAIVVGGALFGRNLRRYTSAMAEARRLRLSAETALEVSRESLARMRERYAPLASSAGPALLVDIADGRLEASDPAVQHACAVEEAFIRTLMRVDGQVDANRALAVRIAMRARERGRVLVVDIPPTLVAAHGPPPSVEESLLRGVNASADEPAMRLSVRREAGMVVLRLLVPIRREEQAMVAELPWVGHVVDDSDPDAPVVLWEWRAAA